MTSSARTITPPMAPRGLRRANRSISLTSEGSRHVRDSVFGTESVAAAHGAGGEVASGTGRFGGGGRPGLADTFPSEGAALEAYQRLVRSESSPGAGRGTVLTVRVRKSDSEAFAKGKINSEQFQQKTTANAYVGAARPGDAARNPAYQRGYNYQDYPVGPVAR